MSALPLTIKERSLWKRLIHQYDAETLKKMIDHYHTYSKTPHEFVRFYQAHYDISLKVRVKDYTWE